MILDGSHPYAKSNHERYEEWLWGSCQIYTPHDCGGLLISREEEQKLWKQLIGQEEADKKDKESGKKKID